MIDFVLLLLLINQNNQFRWYSKFMTVYIMMLNVTSCRVHIKLLKLGFKISFFFFLFFFFIFSFSLWKNIFSEKLHLERCSIEWLESREEELASNRTTEPSLADIFSKCYISTDPGWSGRSGVKCWIQGPSCIVYVLRWGHRTRLRLSL